MSIPILNIQEPWASSILDGIKTIETRRYRLSEKKLRIPIYIAATGTGRPTLITGVVFFTECRPYPTRRSFERDFQGHWVAPHSQFYWKPPGKYGWVIGRAYRIEPFLAPKRGIVWGKTK